MPAQRTEQADIPIHVMPNGDTASARGAAIEALKGVRLSTTPISFRFVFTLLIRSGDVPTIAGRGTILRSLIFILYL